MNLLMITGDRSIPEGRKGAFWYTLQGLKRHWERIDIICPKPKTVSDELMRELEAKNIHFHPNPQGLLTQVVWIARKGSQLHKEYNFSAMTVHEYPPFYNGRGAIRLARQTHIPSVILEIHHIVGHPKAASLTEWVGRILSRYYLPREAWKSTVVRTVNEEVKNILVSWGVDEATIEVVPSFYLNKEFLSSDPQEKKYDLVFCARLVANKGLGNVLQALAKLPEKKLLIIGDGPKKATFERYAKKLGVSDRVTFTGWLPSKEEVVSFVKSARVFLMNSTSEGGPRSALEAMACGVPVITTRVGVMPDVVKDNVNGLFTTGEVDDLTQKIKSLLEDPNRIDAMGQEATKILDRFERDHLIEEYSEFLLTGQHHNYLDKLK